MAEYRPNPSNALEILMGVAYTDHTDKGPKPAVALERLEFSEIVEVAQTVHGAAGTELDARDQDTERLAAFESVVAAAFEKLSKTDPAKTALAISALATGERIIGRKFAARNIYVLTQSEALHEQGLQLWKSLLKDDDSAVQDEAHRHIWRNMNEGGGSEVEERFGLDGLSWEEAMDLLGSYIGALRYDAQRKVGRSALAEVAVPIPPAPTD
jgi:hypothetical protein